MLKKLIEAIENFVKGMKEQNLKKNAEAVKASFLWIYDSDLNDYE